MFFQFLWWIHKCNESTEDWNVRKEASLHSRKVLVGQEWCWLPCYWQGEKSKENFNGMFIIYIFYFWNMNRNVKLILQQHLWKKETLKKKKKAALLEHMTVNAKLSEHLFSFRPSDKIT